MKPNDHFFSELYRAHFTSIYKYTYRILGNPEDAKDVTQNVFLEAYRKSDLLAYHPNPKGWLYLTAQYKIKQFCSQQKPVLPLENLEHLLALPEKTYMDYSCFQSILKKEEFKLFMSYYIYGYSLDELASSLKISKPALKMRLQRIIKKIKKNSSMLKR